MKLHSVAQSTNGHSGHRPCWASIVVGLTVASSVAWAGLLVVGPVSDARTMQMALVLGMASPAPEFVAKKKTLPAQVPRSNQKTDNST